MMSFTHENAREQMSNVDTAWLRMERPTNLMVIAGVMMFKNKLDFNLLKKMVETRFLKYKRFQQRVIQDNRNAYWETDPDFDLGRHVHLTALPGAAGKEELEELVSDLRSTPLDFSKPLWQFHMVENYKKGSAVILRVHHCYADGIALIKVLLSMTDTTPNANGKSAFSESEDEDKEEEGIFEHFFQPVAKIVNNTLKLGRGLLDDITHPSHLVDYARKGVGLAVEAAKVTLMSNDPDTFFKGKLSVSKKVAWSDPLPLKEIKHVGQILGCSINDVVLSAVSGALRGYLLEKGDSVEGVEIRAAIPVNLRPEDEIHSLGNHFGLVFLTLPLGIANPLERLYKVREYMQQLKGSYQALASFGLLGILGYGPNALEQPALDMLSKKATAVMSNVPGPSKPLYLAGGEISELMFWVPQSGNIGMGVSILSYNGSVQFGLLTDERLVSEPRNIINRFSKELDKILFATLLEPWDEPPNPKNLEKIVKNTLDK